MRRAAAAVALLAVLAPAGARANHQGCFVWGEVYGLDTIRTCTYRAGTTSQTVHVGTPNRWRIWVERLDDRGQPVDVTLAEGHGPPAGPPPVVNPAIGENVNVSMMAGCDVAVLCGTIGLLEAGMADGH